MFRRLLFLFMPLVIALASPAQEPGSLQEGPIATSNPDVTSHPQNSNESTLTNGAIVRMTKAGLSDHVIEQAIRIQPGSYDTHSDDLIALKQAGVSDSVISLMLAHGSGLGVRSPLSMQHFPVMARQGAVEVAPLSPSLDEIGVYYQDKTGEWVELKTEKVTIKSGGWIKSAATHGIIKEDRNGTVQGEHSPLILSGGTPLLIYAPQGTTGDEYTFLQFREHGNRREFRVYTGGVFHGGGGSERDEIEFTAKKVARQMYTFNLPDDLTVGEYGVLPPGSAAGSPSLNGNGKMFTFRIAEANAPKKP